LRPDLGKNDKWHQIRGRQFIPLHSALDYHTPAEYARTLNHAIARPAARDESSARRAIA
jgi:hypothetical protein